MASTIAQFDDKEVQKFLKTMEKKLGKLDKGAAKKWGKAISLPVYEDIIRHFEKEQGPNGKWKSHAASTKLAWAGKISFRKVGGKTIPLDPSSDGFNKETGLTWRKPLSKDARPDRLSGKILQDTGALRGSLGPVKRGSNMRLIKGGWKWATRAKTKSGFPYAAAHNNDGKRDKLPQRKFMWLSKEGMKKIANVSLKYLLDPKKK